MALHDTILFDMLQLVSLDTLVTVCREGSAGMRPPTDAGGAASATSRARGTSTGISSIPWRAMLVVGRRKLRCFLVCLHHLFRVLLELVYTVVLLVALC